MASTKAAKHDKTITFKENDELIEVHPKSSQQEHEGHYRAKHGQQRLDKRSAKGVSGLPKKSGQGGKFTWNGPIDEAAAQMEDGPTTLDKNDPNYVDEEEEEEVDRRATDSVVEVAKSENAPIDQ